MKTKGRTGQQQRAHSLLKMFTVRGLPKQRFYDLYAGNPILGDDEAELAAADSQDGDDVFGNKLPVFMQDDEKSSLGEFFGFESDDEPEEEVKQGHHH